MTDCFVMDLAFSGFHHKCKTHRIQATGICKWYIALKECFADVLKLALWFVVNFPKTLFVFSITDDCLKLKVPKRWVGDINGGLWCKTVLLGCGRISTKEYTTCNLQSTRRKGWESFLEDYTLKMFPTDAFIRCNQRSPLNPPPLPLFGIRVSPTNCWSRVRLGIC